MTRKSKWIASQKAEWMVEFENLVKKELPYPHKIEWESAVHFYSQGMEVKESAEKYLESRTT